MSIELYYTLTDELVKNNVITKNNIFDYDSSPYKDEFNNIFSFYQKNLIHNAKYGIVPSVLFFNNNFSINAMANKVNGYYVISLNMGTVVRLIEMFIEKPELLNEEDNSAFLKFETLLDNPINVLMYQNAIHFTFYHEMAHLIQKSQLLENNLYEHLDNLESFSELRHILELDADEFSAISIGAHLLQYAERMFGLDLTNEQIDNLLVISCSSVFLYILSFPSNRREIYYEKFTHPHPVIRITSIIFIVVGYCIETLKAKGIDMNLNSKEIVNKTLYFTKKISTHFFEDSNLISDYIKSLGDEGSNIMDYLTKYQELKDKDFSLAVNKWNLMVKIKESSKKRV